MGNGTQPTVIACAIVRGMTLKALERRFLSAFGAGVGGGLHEKFSNPQQFASTKTQARSLLLDVIYFPEQGDVL